MQEVKPQHKRENTISNLSSYPTIIFGIFLFVAIVLDIIFPSSFLAEPINRYIGITIIVVGTIIVYWSEDLGSKFSHLRKQGEVTTVDNLCTGPYCYSRNPKYVGLALLIIGLGCVLNSIIVTIAAILAVLIVNYFFLDKEEHLMYNRHGEIYKEYTKKVNRWL
jgi:protein-S-isoprenylcysteine O-methyltransferase Ste14